MNEHAMKMGLGDAIKRLIRVEELRARGLDLIPSEMAAERDMIVDALNTHELELGFVCDIPDAPQDVGIFEQAATTSCCRLSPSRLAQRSGRTTAPRRARKKKK